MISLALSVPYSAFSKESNITLQPVSQNQWFVPRTSVRPPSNIREGISENLRESSDTENDLIQTSIVQKPYERIRLELNDRPYDGNTPSNRHNELNPLIPTTPEKPGPHPVEVIPSHEIRIGLIPNNDNSCYGLPSIVVMPAQTLNNAATTQDILNNIMSPKKLHPDLNSFLSSVDNAYHICLQYPQNNPEQIKESLIIQNPSDNRDLYIHGLHIERHSELKTSDIMLKVSNQSINNNIIIDDAHIQNAIHGIRTYQGSKSGYIQIENSDIEGVGITCHNEVDDIGHGIYVSSNNTWIKNTTISGFNYGIAMDANNIYVDNSLIFDNHFGIYIFKERSNLRNNESLIYKNYACVNDIITAFPHQRAIYSENRTRINDPDIQVIEVTGSKKYIQLPQSIPLPQTISVYYSEPNLSCNNQACEFVKSMHITENKIDSDTLNLNNRNTVSNQMHMLAISFSNQWNNMQLTVPTHTERFHIAFTQPIDVLTPGHSDDEGSHSIADDNNTEDLNSMDYREELGGDEFNVASEEEISDNHYQDSPIATPEPSTPYSSPDSQRDIAIVAHHPPNTPNVQDNTVPSETDQFLETATGYNDNAQTQSEQIESIEVPDEQIISANDMEQSTDHKDDAASEYAEEVISSDEDSDMMLGEMDALPGMGMNVSKCSLTDSNTSTLSTLIAYGFIMILCIAHFIRRMKYAGTRN